MLEVMTTVQPKIYRVLFDNDSLNSNAPLRYNGVGWEVVEQLELKVPMSEYSTQLNQRRTIERTIIRAMPFDKSSAAAS